MSTPATSVRPLGVDPLGAARFYVYAHFRTAECHRGNIARECLVTPEGATPSHSALLDYAGEDVRPCPHCGAGADD